MKKCMFLVVAVLLLALSGGVIHAAEYTKMTIILAHSGAMTDSRHIGAIGLKEYIEKNSGGNVKVDLFPAGQLGDSRSLVESTQNGAIQLCIQPAGNLAGFSPLIGVLDAPYLFPGDLEKARIIAKGNAAQSLLDSLAENGMMGFPLWVDLYDAFTSNKPLRTTADFRGLKFRVMASPVLIKMVEALGGSAIPIDYSETFSALQTGAVDGTEAAIGGGIYNMKFYEVQKCLNVTNHIMSNHVIFANKMWFDGLDDATKQLVRDGVKAGEKAFNEKRLAIEAEAMSAIKAAGVQIVYLTPEEIQGLSDAAREVCLEEFIKSNGEKGKAVVDMFNKEIAELN